MRLPGRYLTACLLLLISAGPAHGYQLRDQLRDLAGERRDFGQMHRVLRGLERDGFVVSYWQSSEVGPARRTYDLAERGAERLGDLVSEIEAGHHLTGAFLHRYRSPDRLAGARR